MVKTLVLVSGGSEEGREGSVTASSLHASASSGPPQSFIRLGLGQGLCRWWGGAAPGPRVGCGAEEDSWQRAPTRECSLRPLASLRWPGHCLVPGPTFQCHSQVLWPGGPREVWRPPRRRGALGCPSPPMAFTFTLPPHSHLPSVLPAFTRQVPLCVLRGGTVGEPSSTPPLRGPPCPFWAGPGPGLLQGRLCRPGRLQSHGDV